MKISKILIHLIFVFTLTLSQGDADAQNQILDSLWNDFENANHDTTKIKLYINIGDFFENTNPDSAKLMYNKANILADNLLSNNNNNLIKRILSLKAIALRYTGIVEKEQGNFDVALQFFRESLNISEKNNDIKGIVSSNNCLGATYRSYGKYDEALKYYMKSLKIAEKTKDQNSVLLCLNNIGNVHLFMESFSKALEFYFKSMEIATKLNDEKSISMCNNNIGEVYRNMAKKVLNNKVEQNILFEKAIESYNKSIKYKNQINDLRGIAGTYNNIGNIYLDQHKHKEALELFYKTLEISKNVNDNSGIAMVLGNISALHFYIADTIKNIDLKKFYYTQSISYGHEALFAAERINALQWISSSSDFLKKAYTAIGNTKKALEFANKYITTKDSLFSFEKTKSLAEMEAKYETEKKQLQIENLEKDNKLKIEENNKQKIVIYSFILGFIIILVFSIFLYRLFIQKKKANKQLAQKNIEVEQKNEEITAQRDEISAQRDLVTKQKTEIEHIHEELTDSINYAKRIQEAVLPISEEYRSIMGEHFILFRPKDIVSGDFYWTAKIENTLIVAVADCTGHGVPGAFMSMLGISFLNEIIRNKEITKANEVLNELRKEIINALQQKGQSGEQKDGMDMSLLAIDTNTNKAQWAGANNPLWIVKSPKPQNQNSKTQELETLPKSLDLGLEAWFFELKPDKMPIAIYEKMDSFTNNEIQLEKGDCLYLMSDGYEDQFGGPKGKKFLSKNLKQLLVSNCQVPMNEQKEILERTLINWIGDGEQIDDITLVGIKI